MRLSLHEGGVAYGRLARLTGGLAGLGIVIAAVSPFSGVPPRSGSSSSAPAQVEVSVLATGEFTLAPFGKALPPTAFPAPGAPGGPSLAVSVTNITAVPLRIAIKLTAVAPSLDTAARVRGSVAGAVVVDGPLAKAGDWSRAVGLLPSGATTTLRLKFKLLPGQSPDAYLGHLDVRQLEIRGVKANGAPASRSVMREIPDPSPTPVAGSAGPSPTSTPKPTTLPTPAATSVPPADGPVDQSGSIPEGENATGFE